MQKYRVLYLKDPTKPSRESKSPWFFSKDRARQALGILRQKYGHQNAIIYVD